MRQKKMKKMGKISLLLLFLFLSLTVLLLIGLFSVTREPFLTPAGQFHDIASVLLRPEEGATIYYTLDGTQPTVQSPSTAKEIALELDQTTTVRAYAVRPGKIPSGVVSKTYTVDISPYRPVLSLDGGTYRGTVFVHATSVFHEGVEIRYTLDGSDPTLDSPLFKPDIPVVLLESTTLKVRSFQGDLPLNRIVTQHYEIEPVTEQPTLSGFPEPGVYEGSVTVPLTGGEKDGLILYTEDGSQPTALSAVARQGEKLSFDRSVKLRLLPVREAWNPGEVISLDYTIRNPKPLVETIESKSSADRLSIQISVPTPDSVVYYTTDGSKPDENAQLISDKKTLRITRETIIKAMTKAEGREDSQLFTKKYKPRADSHNIKDSGEKVVALTFDDGPGKYTDALLKGLKTRGVKATFFMLGINVEKFPEEVKKMARDGHELGNHTWAHTIITGLSNKDYKLTIKKTNDLIQKLTKIRPTLFRPPGGAFDRRKIPEGMTRVMWTVDTNDWRYRDEDYVYKYVVEHAKDGDIILLHEIYETSVNAILRAIDTLQEEGFVFVSYSELQEYV